MDQRPEWCPERPPCVSVRLPGPFAQLVAAGSWTSFFLPDVRQGGRALQVAWEKLGIQRNTLPAVPAALLALPADDSVQLDVPAALAAIDLLKRFAATVDGQEDGGVYGAVSLSVHRLQVFADQLDPGTYRRSMIDVKGRADMAMKGRRAYRVAFMIKAFMFADTLKQADIKQARPAAGGAPLRVPDITVAGVRNFHRRQIHNVAVAAPDGRCADALGPEAVRAKGPEEICPVPDGRCQRPAWAALRALRGSGD